MAKVKFNKDYRLSNGASFKKDCVYEIESQASIDRWVRRGCKVVSEGKALSDPNSVADVKKKEEEESILSVKEEPKVEAPVKEEPKKEESKVEAPKVEELEEEEESSLEEEPVEEAKEEEKEEVVEKAPKSKKSKSKKS